MAAGGTVTGVSPLATEAEAAAQLASAPSANGGAATLVTEPATLVPEPGSLAAQPGRVAPPGIVPPAVEPGQLALLPYSSGTTGLPKPVLLSHANLTAAARQLGTGLALTPRDRFVALAPLAHVMGFVVSLCAPLTAGATVVMLPRFELAALLDAIQRHRVTVLAVPPPVLADTGLDVRPGEPGELWVRGPQVMAGYLGRPEATAEMLGAGGWLRTGDLGRVDAGGYLFIVDRLKELIKVNAIQVAPAELEALLAGHPQVADAAVVPRPDERTGEAPVAFVVARGPLEPGQLIAWVAARVAPHKRIRAVRLVREIPRTPSGKILRRLLVDADREQSVRTGH